MLTREQCVRYIANIFERGNVWSLVRTVSRISKKSTERQFLNTSGRPSGDQPFTWLTPPHISQLTSLPQGQNHQKYEDIRMSRTWRKTFILNSMQFLWMPSFTAVCNFWNKYNWGGLFFMDNKMIFSPFHAYLFLYTESRIYWPCTITLLLPYQPLLMWKIFLSCIYYFKTEQ